MVPRLLFMMLGAVFHLGITVYGKPNMKASLKSLHVMSDIKYRFATTQISMTYYNPYNFSVTADLHVNMPHNSFISNFTMEIDGNVTVGEVKEKSVAKEIFEKAKETGQSAGYVEVEHRFTNVFDISVNVESQKYIVYNLTYQELLTRQANKYRHIIHLSNGGIIDDFLVEVFIIEPQDIIDLAVSNITDDKLNITDDGELESALIEYISSREIYIKYNPSRKQQEEISKDGIAGLLKVAYDVDRKNDSNLIYVVGDYFVHFFTPDSLPSLPKNIIFMLDVSGSMSGDKIKQLKEAMENILDQLDPKLDKFLIGKFSNKVSWMRESFLTADEVNKQLGKKYIQGLRATGGTNINSALMESNKKHEVDLPGIHKSITIFLTDGQATSGVNNIEDIKKNVKDTNTRNVSLFTLAFGEDCDSIFLHEIATENGGFSRKIYVDSDSKLQIENLYKEISNILLKDITFVYLNEAVNTSCLSATSFSSYFKGSEIVVSGLLSQQNQSTVNVKLIMTDYSGLYNQISQLKIIGDDFTIDDDLPQNPKLTKIQLFSKITEKTYAYLTLKQLLKQDRTTEARKDILDLALKYNFVTPLTSMVVTKSRVKEKHFEEGARPDYGVQHRVNQLFDLHRSIGARPDYVVQFKSNKPTKTPATIPTTTQSMPVLPHTPAIVIKPVRCKSNLCVTDTIQCRNQTKIDLLTDKLAKIYIYGYVKRISSANCLETLHRVIVKVRNIVYFEFNPEYFKMKGKSYDTTNQKEIRVKLKRFLRISVNFQKTVNSERFISLHFEILSKFIRPKGILSDYATDFHCTENQPNQMKLSNKAAIFNKVNYKTASGSVDQCYKM